MKLTLNEVSKKIKELCTDYDYLRALEERNCTFLCAVGEDVNDVRPEYDFDETQTKLNELQALIRKYKHALNVANTTTVVDGFTITIDEMLIYIPQLTRLQNKYATMRNCNIKARVGNSYNSQNYIDYKYINYDLDKAKEKYAEISAELDRARLALDYTNANTTIEIDS